MQRLAAILHRQRVTELKAGIQHFEKEFLRLTDEISSIEKGEWDDRLEEADDTKTTRLIAADEEEKQIEQNIEAGEGIVTEQQQPEAASQHEAIPPTTQETEVDEASEPATKLLSPERPASALSLTPENMDLSTPLPDTKVVDRPTSPSPAASAGLRTLRGDAQSDAEAKNVQEEQSSVAEQQSEDHLPVPSTTRARGTRSRSASTVPVPPPQTSATATVNESSPGALQQQSQKRFQAIILNLWRDISSHRFATIFQTPITNSVAPNYSELVFSPTDLKTIRLQIRDGIIRTSAEFHVEILRMFANAIMFNQEDSTVADMTSSMLEAVDALVSDFRESEANGNNKRPRQESVPKDEEDNENSSGRKRRR